MKVYQPRHIVNLMLLLPFSLFAQEKSADTGIYHQALYNTISYYNQFRGGPTAGLYNGTEQMGYFYFIEGSAYYGTTEWQKGSIFYDGIFYPDVSLKYDQVKDVVIVPHPNGFTAIGLFGPRIPYFTIGNSKFEYLTKTTDGDPPSGFYEVVESGKLRLLVRRTKKINENILSADLKQKFEEIYSYYIQKDGVYHLVKNESSALDLVKEKKTEIQKLLKKEKIKFRKNRELALVHMVRYYNQN